MDDGKVQLHSLGHYNTLHIITEAFRGHPFTMYAKIQKTGPFPVCTCTFSHTTTNSRTLDALPWNPIEWHASKKCDTV